MSGFGIGDPFASTPFAQLAAANGVVSYYAPPAVACYTPAPAVSYYAPPAVSYYAPAAVSYYAPPVVSYPAPAITTTRYGRFGRPRVTTTYYPGGYFYP